ncbi:MAG: molecular chaperone DnaJ [Dehalococcoidia bacterium]|nr:molecular chaperone DnaJ [Dehalococcoidia bacterium]
MQKRDYYEILGVDRNVDEAGLKKAYRTLAMKLHPDKNPGDDHSADKMTELNEAYAVLCNGDKRKRYDRYGHAGLEGYSQDDIFSGVDFSSVFGDLGLGGGIFEQFFGGGARRGRTTTRTRQRGDDLRYDLEVTLEEVAAGVDRTVELSKAEKCSKCRGSGAATGGAVTCDRCRGTGQVVTERTSGYSIFRQISVCDRCRGAGQKIKDPCDQCAGRGILENKKQITIHVPEGVETGNAIKVPGEGTQGESGASAGDLYVVVNVKKHEVFERHGDDLYTALGLSIVSAALGGEAKVPGIAGELIMNIPAGTQTGAVLRRSGQGLPKLHGRGKGDLYAVVTVVTPTGLGTEAKELLRQFAIVTGAEAPGDGAAGGSRAEFEPEGGKKQNPIKKFVGKAKRRRK